MYSFQNDYSQCCHPAILKRLASLGTQAFSGYGTDEICASAADKIRKTVGCPQAAVHFLTGGTQTNMIVIDALLRPWEAVIAADSGHIHVHETGAVEGTGHKVLTARTKDGKLTPSMIEEICRRHTDEHMVRPRMVYLSDSTELGTIYTKAELTAIHELCRRRELYLFLDGARLGAALCAETNDLAFTDLPRLCDVFYIGGTKNGAMLGEAVVIPDPSLFPDFRYQLKHRGGMLAKGFLLGVNFDVLFTDSLYMQLAAQADRMASRLREGLIRLQIPMFVDAPANQLFPVLPNSWVDELQESFTFEVWSPAGPDRTCIRLTTSWATDEAAVDALLTALQKCRETNNREWSFI